MNIGTILSDPRPFVFKIKVRADNQEFHSIASYKVYGYWKRKGEWFWKPLGLLHHQRSDGRYKPSMDATFLQKAENEFVERLKQGNVVGNRVDGRQRIVGADIIAQKINR